MREIDPTFHLQLLSPSPPPGGAGKITKSINGNIHRIRKRGTKIGRREMREVMLDVVNLRPESLPRESSPDGILQGTRLGTFPEAIQDQLQVRPAGQQIQGPAKIVDPRIEIDRQMFQVTQLHAGFAQTVLDGLRRQTRPMLDPAETFLFHGSHQTTLADQCRR